MTEITSTESTTTSASTTPVLNPADRLQTANATVKNYSLISMAVGLVELVPMALPVDVALLTGLQIRMLHSLAVQYDVPFSKDLGTSIIGSLVGGVLVPAAVIRPVATVIRFIPGIGQIVGAASMVGFAAIAAATTYAVGRVFIQHFESGGTFLTFDPEQVRKYFAEEFEKGKQIAANLKTEGTSA